MNAQLVMLRDKKFHENTTYKPTVFKFIAIIR